MIGGLISDQIRKTLSMAEEEEEAAAASQPLIQSQDVSTHNFPFVRGFIDEAKKQLGLALPLIAVNMLQYCLQLISLMFVGHLDQLSLSTASIATSFANVTGFSVLVSILCF